jgi:hypothetical protein|tara:strand:- start:370 stop:831 length:462 start_codon:yes stop_codon:yes gene_type:complete
MSIKKILRQETILSEQFSDDPNTFTTEIQDVDFYGLENYFPEYKGRDMDVVYLNCYVNWRYDLDIRSWGIKDISVYTTSVIINATVEIYDEDYTGVEVEKEIEIAVDDMGGFRSDDPDKWYYEDEKDNERYHTILPTGLQVDLNDKTVSVIWN